MTTCNNSISSSASPALSWNQLALMMKESLVLRRLVQLGLDWVLVGCAAGFGPGGG
jgi:hypothetical protein